MALENDIFLVLASWSVCDPGLLPDKANPFWPSGDVLGHTPCLLSFMLLLDTFELNALRAYRNSTSSMAKFLTQERQKLKVKKKSDKL